MARTTSTAGTETTTYPVQFVFELPTEAFVDAVVEALPGPDVRAVRHADYQTYIDETPHGHTVVGGSVPYYALSDAENLYARLRGLDATSHIVSGSLTIRRYTDVARSSASDAPPVLERTTYP